MKKFKKIVSLISTLALVASYAAINVNAANKVYTISVTDVNGQVVNEVKKDQELLITVSLNDCTNVSSFEYQLILDEKVKAKEGTHDVKVGFSTVSYGNWLDTDWYLDPDSSSPCMTMLTTKDCKYKETEHAIGIACAATSGIPADVAGSFPNEVVGKYYVVATEDFTASNKATFSIKDGSVTETLNGTNTPVIVSAESVTIPTVTEPDPIPAKVDTLRKNNREEVAEGSKYTQGFMYQIIPNSETINNVDFILKSGGKELDSTANEKGITGWSDLKISGTSTFEFAINVLNVDWDATVEVEFSHK